MQRSTAGIVADFYAALAAGDAESVAASIDGNFSEDAAIEWPPSLPHGGRIVGRRKLRAIFGGIAKAGNDAGATNLTLVRTIGDGDRVVAELTFDWRAPGAATATPNSALELWSFSDGELTEIRAYYWDTTAITADASA
jgi:ketosteroid isomerase-like protein